MFCNVILLQNRVVLLTFDNSILEGPDYSFMLDNVQPRDRRKKFELVKIRIKKQSSYQLLNENTS